MAQQDDLSVFVRDALIAGKSRAEISMALTDAGWSVSEARDALSGWVDTTFVPPIPRPKATVSARDFFVYGLTFAVLLLGAFNLVLLLQGIVDMAFAEESRSGLWRIRWGASVLIVTVPLYLWLTFRERRKLAHDPALRRSAIRKWLTYIALLLAALTLLLNLIATINSLLTGDLTLQFMLKALAVFGVAGGIFLFYLTDMKKGDPA